jgi:dUTP pyrophosphatase
MTQKGEDMKVRIVKTDPNAVVPFKTHDSDFCYDVVATSCEQIAHNVYRYGTGLRFEIIRDNELLSKSGSVFAADKKINLERSSLKLSIDARSRSSIWKTGMVMANSIGTIDEDYRGEVSFVFYHVMSKMPKYKVGDKIAQIKIGTTLPIEFEEAFELSDTERGEGREGSTGK